MLTKSPDAELSSTQRRNQPAFDYSEDEWAEIKASIHQLRQDRLLTKLRRILSAAAQSYLDALRAVDRRADRRALKAHWHKITKISEKLQREVSACAERALAESHREMLPWEIDNRFDAGMASIQLFVETVGMQARLLGRRFDYWRDPRLLFQSQVLETWIWLGGKLKIARNSESQVSGPLARFFFAVARPVMRERAPSPESLPEIVNRQKRTRAESHKPGTGDGPAWFNHWEWLQQQRKEAHEAASRSAVLKAACKGRPDYLRARPVDAFKHG
jgi:hypothetical protein